MFRRRPLPMREKLLAKHRQSSTVKVDCTSMLGAQTWVMMSLSFALCIGSSSLVLAGRQRVKPVLTLRNANHPTISADGSRVAVAPDSRVVEVYQVFPKHKLRTFRPGGSWHWLSADGRTLATNGDSGLHLWEVESGKELARIAYGIEIVKQYERWLSDAASFSSDLGFVADLLLPRTGGREITPGIAVWDLEKRKLMRMFGENKHEKDFWGAVFLSPDARLMAASRNNVDNPERNVTVVWETQSGREMLRLPFACFWLAISTDGQRLATDHKVSGGGEAFAFSMTEKGELLVQRTPGAEVPTEPTRYLIQVWEIQTGRKVSVIGGGEYKTATRAAAGALSPDGKLLATSSLGYIVLWNADTGELLTSVPHDGHIPPREGIGNVGFSGDGRYLVTGSTPTEVVKIWRVADLLQNPAVEPR